MMIFCFNKSNVIDIEAHLIRVSPLFVPELSSYVDIKQYANKIYLKANRIEAWENGVLVGLLAYYVNKEDNLSFITNVSVESSYQRKGVSHIMLEKMLMELNGVISNVRLEVNCNNKRAYTFYLKHGFKIVDSYENTMVMEKRIGEELRAY